MQMKKPMKFFFKTRVWEQKRWNRWDLVARAEGMGEEWVDTWSLSRVAFDLALCHALRGLGERSGVPRAPGRRRESEELHRIPMRMIHPRYRSSPSRH